MLDQMIRTDIEGHPLFLADREGLFPIYFNQETRPDPDPFFDEIIDLSQQFWTYLGYTGLMVPWHEEDPYKFLKIRRDKIRMFLYRMDEMDVHWKSYCVLSFLMTHYTLWERPALLLNQRTHWGWFEYFRAHAGSRERVDDVAFFMLEFVQLLVRNRSRVAFGKELFTAPNPQHVARGSKKPGQYLILYHRIADRIASLGVHGVDYIDWLREKFATCMEINPDKRVAINAIVNVNSIDPDLDKLRRRRVDPWRQIREFLGLSPDCVFPDNCVPKGWRPSSDDGMDISKITSVQADGYYYYEDGTQRRGKRHYAGNKYLCIMCVPSNFVDFKVNWDDPRFLAGNPSWEEYSEWGRYPGIWNEKGLNVTNYVGIRDVRWRRRT
jgi:hypothetical protein